MTAVSPSMGIMMSGNALTALAYYWLTYQLVAFAVNSKMTHITSTLRNSKDKSKRNLYYMILAVGVLFASFITLCGNTHALRILSHFFPSKNDLRVVELIMMTLCAMVSIGTAFIASKLFPVILENMKEFELNGEGQLQHVENYMIEVIELVKESVLVLSERAEIIRCNQASKGLLNNLNLLGLTYTDFIHPNDLSAFQSTVARVLSDYSMAPVTIEYRVSQKVRAGPFQQRPQAGATVGKNKSLLKTRVSAGKVYVAPPLDPFGGVNQDLRRGTSIAKADSVSSRDSQQDGASVEDLIADTEERFIWVETTLCKGMTLNQSNDFEYDLKLVSRNIDDRKRESLREYNDLIKENEERERTNAAKLGYITCIAHDLKTPLQSFSYFLDLLRQSLLTPEQSEYLQQANVAVDLMRLTISQTMDISKALTGAKLMPRRTTVHLTSILSRVEVIINGFGKEVPVTFIMAPNICDRIITDEEWLWQMILNLLTNACKHTSRGEIIVSLTLKREPPEKSEESVKGEMLLVEVADTGIGISPDKIGSMFDAFAQVQEGQVTGTGLGLFGVRTRAEGLLGTCGARHNTKSSTGTGTVLWFTIQYTPEEPYAVDSVRNTPRTASSTSILDCTATFSDDCAVRSPSPFPPPEPSNSFASDITRSERCLPVVLPSGRALRDCDDFAVRTEKLIRSRKLTALVIDDTKTVCKLMERLLMKMGFESVKCYENGSKGLEAMMAAPVDIVFSDVQMPIMTGPEMTRRFRAFEEEALAKGTRSARQLIVAVTANGSELNDRSCGSFDEVYPKPLSVREILVLVQKYFM